MLHLGNFRLIDWVIEYARVNFPSNDIFIATSQHPNNNNLCDYLSDKDLRIFRGDETDVFSRFFNIIKNFDLDDIAIRFTGDNPLKYNKIITMMKNEMLTKDIDYMCLEGLSKLAVEFIRVKLFYKISRSRLFSANDKEHVTWSIRNDYECKKKILKQSSLKMVSQLDKLLTIDTKDDFVFLSTIIENLNLKPGDELNINQLYDCIRSHRN